MPLPLEPPAVPLAIPVPRELAGVCLAPAAGVRAGVLFADGVLAGCVVRTGVVAVVGAGVLAAVRLDEGGCVRRLVADDPWWRRFRLAFRGTLSRGTAGVATSPVTTSPLALCPSTSGFGLGAEARVADPIVKARKNAIATRASATPVQSAIALASRSSSRGLGGWARAWRMIDPNSTRD